MWRLQITKEMSIEQTVELMAEKNSQARSILYHLATKADPRLLLSLDDMNMRGVQIVYAFAGFCKANTAKFKTCVRLRNKEMVDYVNKCTELMNAQGIGYHQKAVARGGAPR